MHPTILAIDTAADVCSVALARAGEIREEREVVGHRHSERVLPMVEMLFAAAGIGLADCDALAFGAGPGAFTGLRIACGMVQGLAYGARKPVIAVGNLEALAAAALLENAGAMRVLCANDARMQEAYVAVYQRSGEDVVELAGPALASAAELDAWLVRWRPDVVAGDAPVSFRVRFPQRAGAAAIAERALRRWESGERIDPSRAAPLYVRDHVALTIAERHARRETSA